MSHSQRLSSILTCILSLVAIFPIVLFRFPLYPRESWGYIWDFSCLITDNTGFSPDLDTYCAAYDGIRHCKLNTTGMCDNFSQVVTRSSGVRPVASPDIARPVPTTRKLQVVYFPSISSFHHNIWVSTIDHSVDIRSERAIRDIVDTINQLSQHFSCHIQHQTNRSIGAQSEHMAQNVLSPSR